MKIFEDSREDALKYAFRLLGYRDRSEKELCEKLSAKGFSNETIEYTVGRLKDRGLVDDRKLAAALRRIATEGKLLSRSGVKGYLLKRGIPDNIADEVLREEIDYSAIAARLVEKKLRSLRGADPGTVRRRLYGMLSRKGFPYDTIRRTFKSFDLEEEDNEGF